MLVTENNSYFIVFISQESRRNLAGCLWPRASHKAAVRVSARAVISKIQLGLKGPLPSSLCGLWQTSVPHRLLVSGPVFLPRATISLRLLIMWPPASPSRVITETEPLWDGSPSLNNLVSEESQCVHPTFKEKRVILFFYYLFIYLLAVLGLHRRTGFSLLAVSWGLFCSCCVQASHRGCSSYCGARALSVQASVVAACGISPDQGWNLCLRHWQADSLPLSHQGNPEGHFTCHDVASAPFCWLSHWASPDLKGKGKKFHFSKRQDLVVAVFGY